MNWRWLPHTGRRTVANRCCFAFPINIAEPDFELDLELRGARIAYLSIAFQAVLTRIELLFAERRALRQQGPRLKLFYRCGDNAFGSCGSVLLAVAVVFRGREVCLPLGDSIREFLEYLCRTRQFPQSAGQIVSGIAGIKLATSEAKTPGKRIAGRKIRRDAVKTYIARARMALDYGFEKLSIPLRSAQVLVSEQSVSNQVLYQLRASVEVVSICQGN
jgi:hypothetical protein